MRSAAARGELADLARAMKGARALRARDWSMVDRCSSQESLPQSCISERVWLFVAGRNTGSCNGSSLIQALVIHLGVH